MQRMLVVDYRAVSLSTNPSAPLSTPTPFHQRSDATTKRQRGKTPKFAGKELKDTTPSLYTLCMRTPHRRRCQPHPARDPAASAKGADGACAAKVRVAVDGPRGGALPG